jgi:hypothetical protein
MVAFRCHSCSALSIGQAIAHNDELHMRGLSAEEYLSQPDAPIEWIPPAAVGRVYEDVPEHIGEAAGEAHLCESVGAHRSAVLLARAVVEATAKDQGITTGNLRGKIDELFTRGLVREIVRDQAHEIRYLGNDMAHGDFVDPVTAEESAETLVLMAEVLREVYQAPARLQAVRAARQAKKQRAIGQTGQAATP